MVEVNKWVDGIDTAVTNFNLCHTYTTLFHDVYAVKEQKVLYEKKSIETMEEVPFYDQKWVWIKKQDRRNLRRTGDLTRELNKATEGSYGAP